jgi:hypothetical protein
VQLISDRADAVQVGPVSLSALRNGTCLINRLPLTGTANQLHQALALQRARVRQFALRADDLADTHRATARLGTGALQAATLHAPAKGGAKPGGVPERSRPVRVPGGQHSWRCPGC